MVFVVGERSGEISNMSTIQDLYYGRISPYEMSISATPEYQKLKALATQNEDLLRKTLSDEQKELLEKLTEISQTYPPSQNGICLSPDSDLE